jgi:signal transduction histidine kinase
VTRPITLSRTLSLTIGGGLLVLSLLLALAVTQGVARLMDGVFQDKADALARQLAIISLDALLVSDYGTLERYLLDLKQQPGVRYLRVRRDDGEILGEVGEPPEPRTAADEVLAEWPVNLGAHRLGDVLVSYDRAPVQEAIRIISLQWAGGLLLLITVLYFWLRRTLERRLVRPMQALATRIGSGDDVDLIHHGGLPEEITRIAETFGALCSEIEEKGRRHEAAERLASRTLERLSREQRLASVGQMAAGLAHSLNTPLGNILGYTQQAMEGAADPKLRQRLLVIEEQAGVCSGIVRNLLDAVHPPEAHPLSLDVTEPVDAVLRLMEPILRDRGIRQITREGACRSRIWADPSCVEQVLFNLLTNAVDAGAQALRLCIEETEDRVHLLVEDDGAGVPTAIRANLFKPFVTSKPRGKGTGLGLHICKTLLRSTGGDIALENPGPGGTRFRITWRTVAAESAV